MSPTQTITLIALCAYFLSLVILNWWGQRSQTADDYAIGARNVGYIATTGTLAAGIRDGSGIILWVSFGYNNGYGGLWIIFGLFSAFCLIAAFGPHVRRLSVERDYLTINQMLRDDIGIYTEKFATIMMLIIAVLIMSMQIYVAGNFFSSLLRQPEWIGMVSVAVLVGFYLFAGGYNAVIRTNTIQFFWVISLIIIPFLIVPETKDVMDFKSIVSMGPINSIALFLIGLGYPLVGGDVWQHVFSARNDKVIRWGFPMAGPALLIMTLSLIFLGFGIKTFMPDANPKTALFDFYQAELISPYVLSYVAIVIVAITTSALDSQTYLFISTAIKNIAPPSVAQDKARYKHWARMCLIGSLSFTTLIALTISDLIQFLFDAVSLLYVLAPIFVFAGLGWIKKSTMADRLITIIAGISSAVFVWLFVNEILAGNLPMTLLPAGISLVGCSAVALSQKFGLLSRK
jgi:SSS family solute:Na+ symporter